MANSYSAPNFDIDTNTDVAGLAALKGSAPALTDYLYVFNGATVTFESDISILEWYIGDNSAGTAATKTGHIVGNPGVTVTFGTNTAHCGMNGEGGTSTVTFNGTAASSCKITDANADKYGNYNIRYCVQTYQHTTFEHAYSPIRSGAANKITLRNCTFDDCYFTFSYSASEFLPAVAQDCVVKGCVYGIYDGTSTTPQDILDYFSKNQIRFEGNANGGSALLIRFGTTSGISRYAKLKFSPAPMSDHKVMRRGGGI